MASGLISMEFGLRGPNLCIVTACATSNNAIGEAWRIIKFGDADIFLAGGSEASIIPIGLGGFSAMKALSTRNDEPQARLAPVRSRPRRLRHGRRRRRRRGRGTRTRQSTRRENLVRTLRLRTLRRRLPHDGAAARWRRRGPGDEDGARPRWPCPEPRSTTSTRTPPRPGWATSAKRARSKPSSAHTRETVSRSARPNR